jgi:sialate O-acetylesterase
MFRYAEDPDYKHWCIIRQAQMKVFRTIKNTGLAVALDCGEFNNIHPVDKTEVGKRLYLQAMSEVYGLMDRKETLPPVYREFYTDGAKAVLLFDNTEGGTALEGWQEDFEIAGSDGVWHRADTGSFIGDKICISSREVSEPVAVRFQWTNYAEVRLFGKNGLPVPPLNTLDKDTVSDGSEGTVIRII